ncbi:MAG: acetyltransferase [Bacteroidota bacterium]
MAVLESDKLLLLGQSEGEIPVIMDLAYSVFGMSQFEIIQNLALPDFPFRSDLYKRSIFLDKEFEFKKNQKQPVHFGVLHSNVKYILFDHFLTKYGITKDRYITLVDPKSSISPSSSLGKGNLIQPQSTISAMCELGFGVTIKNNSAISHHAQLGDFVNINPGVTLSGFVEIGEGTEIGSGAVISNNIRIGKRSFIGAGSVVTRDIPDDVIAYGNPCKVIRKNERWDKVSAYLKTKNSSTLETNRSMNTVGKVE